MKSIKYIMFSGVLLLLASTSFCKQAHSCSVRRVLSAKEITEHSEVIIRAKVVEEIEIENSRLNSIKFEVLEIIKGECSSQYIQIKGYLGHYEGRKIVQEIHPGPPYNGVRDGGTRGTCYAYDYKLNTEFLLFLNDGTPYWSPLAATNEEVQGPDDPWVTWVKTKAVVDPEAEMWEVVKHSQHSSDMMHFLKTSANGKIARVAWLKYKQLQRREKDDNTGQSVPQPSTIVKSFPAPSGTQPSGLTWHDGYLWLSSYKRQPGIYKIHPETGKREETFQPAIVWDNRYGGLAATDSFLVHIQANRSNRIVKLAYPNLDVKDSFSIEDLSHYFSDVATQENFESDVAIQENVLWVIGNTDALDAESYRLYQISLRDGSVVSMFDIPEGTQVSQNYGMTFDGAFLWFSSRNMIHKIHPESGKVISHFELPANRLESLAWDGSHLWAASFHGMIYKICVDDTKKCAREEN